MGKIFLRIEDNLLFINEIYQIILCFMPYLNFLIIRKPNSNLGDNHIDDWFKNNARFIIQQKFDLASITF